MPEFEGKVNCIYIDPPYNTGNEGWIYNDNVSDPKLKKWLGEVVGKEGEDLSRHDKWLCMMYPRLKLLHRLLAENGSIWISLDDNESHYLKCVVDEIFGRDCFIMDFIWQKRDGAPNDRTVGSIHEHIFVWGKRRKAGATQTIAEENFRLMPRTEKANSQYRVFAEPGGLDPRGPFRKIDTTANGKGGRFVESLTYAIVNPYTGEEVRPRKGTCWRHNQEEMERLQADKRIYWGVKGTATTPMRKLFEFEAKDGMTTPSIWSDVGFNQHASSELEQVFGHKAHFDTPKPVSLLERIIHVATRPDSIVLDSFAGSGTTAHAVLKLNAQDGGNRRFILTEMMNYAETITAERVRRVMDGYGEGNKAVAGLGGSFDYFTVGERLLQEDGLLNPAVGLSAIRDYVAWTDGIPIGQCSPMIPTVRDGNASSPYWLGEALGLGIFFAWEDDRSTTLDLSLLTQLVKKSGRYLIYADQCALSTDFMRRHNIVYKKIPRDITRL